MRDDLADEALATLQQITLAEEDLPALDGALITLRDVAANAADKDSDWSMYLRAFCAGLRMRFGLSGAPEDLSNSVLVAQEASEGAPEELCADLRYEMMEALWWRFQYLGDPADLDNAIGVARLLMATVLEDDFTRIAVPSELADMLAMRYSMVSDLTDLDEAITVRRRLLPMIPDDDDFRSGILVVLGNTLRLRFERLSLPADLDEAIAVLEQVMRSMPDDHPSHSRGAYELSVVLRKRFLLNRDQADVDAAVSIARQEMARGDTAGDALLRNALSDALGARFEANGDPADLDEAIAAGRQAVALLAEGHLDESIFRNALSGLLRMRASRTGARTDLDEAISVQREALELVPEHYPAVPQFLHNLSAALLARATREDVDEAVAISRLAAQATGHPRRAEYLHGFCSALLARFGQTGDLADLNDAVAAGTATLDLPSPHQTAHVALLAEVLSKRYEAAGDPADLDQAIMFARSVSATPLATPRFLFSLGTALWQRFEISGQTTDRDDAISFGRQAALAAPDAPAGVPYCLAVVSALRARFEATGEVSDLDDAVTIARQAVRIAPDEVDCLSSLAGALLVRFSSTGNRADLDDAITVGEHLVAVSPPDHEELAGYQENLAWALRTRFEHFGGQADQVAAEKWERLAGVERDPFDSVVGPDDGAGWAAKRGLQGAFLLQRAITESDPAALDQGIILIQQAVELFPDGDAGKAEAMANLATALMLRFTRIGSPEDLDRAIDVGRAAVSAGGGATAQRTLASALHARFMRLGDLPDVDEAITVGRACADAVTDREEQVIVLSNLSIALRSRYALTSQLPDLEEAITAGRAGLDVAMDADRAIPLSNLGATLQLRFERLGDPADLDEAIELGRAAVAAITSGHPDRAAALANLGSALNRRSEWSADPADLDEGIAMSRAAVAACPPGYSGLPMYLSNLGNALRQRYTWTGDLADLDAGITASRSAVDACPAGHPDRARYLSNLSVQLRGRFGDLGEQADLAAAVTAGHAASDAAPMNHPERPKYLANLGMTLLYRFGVDAELPDLEEAIRLCRAALDSAPPGHPDRPMCLMSLASALHARFNQAYELSDLDEATALARTALASVPPGYPDRALYLSSLNELLLSRGSATGALGDVDEAITASREAVETAGASAIRAMLRTALAQGLRLRFAITGAPSDLDEALALWRAVADDHTAPPSMRLSAGRTIGDLAAAQGRWAKAVDGYAIAVEMMPLAAWRGSGRASRERQLATWAGIASEAAACAIAADRPDRAIELLEHGRGVLWSQSLDARTDITALRAAAPALAARLNAVRTDLNSVAHSVERRMSLAVQWDALVREARAVPGFEAFLRPPRADQLRTAAAGGTVVIINTSPWRCDALLVTTEDAQVVKLPALTQDEVVAQATAYLNALLATEAGDVFAELDINTTLEWLWDTVVEPVLGALGNEQSRVWWCPTGPFSLLPLHAAGYHDERTGRSALDRVISSYTPTLRSLAQAISASRQPADNRFLIVALPETPGQHTLPNVEREQDLLINLFPVPRHTLIKGPAATHDTIRAQLRKHAWAHFSCHGDQQLGDPSQGGLLLYDGILTIAELANEQYSGEFAFLSACKTAVGGVQVPDEAISLAAALHYTGWRHVIGTLWSVEDDAAADITADVYHRLADNGEMRPHAAAQALHDAVRRQRDASPGQPTIWAPFIHAGP